MSVYAYNNCWVQYCRTLEFKAEEERDPTNTDKLYTKYTVRVRGFVTPSQGQFPVAGSGGTDSAALLNGIKDALETPRRPFTYSIAGNVLVDIGSGVKPVLDARIGPDPLPAVVREVTSGTFMVECGVVCRVVECDNVCEERNPVISLRWSQSESFDQNWYSHLSTTGRLIVRSDLMQSADQFRPQATPPVLPDYIRRSSKYTLSPDGLMMDFVFDDVEVDRLPPSPATKATGSYTVVVARPGVTRMGSVDLRLEAPKGVDRKVLMVRAIAMCYSKLEAEGFRNIGPKGGTASPILDGEFTEDLFNVAVHVRITAMLPPLTGAGLLSIATGLGAAALTALGKGSIDAPQVMRSVGLNTYGLASNRRGILPPDRKRIAALLTAAFSDPCACAEVEVSLSTKGSPPSASTNPSMGPVSSGGGFDVSISTVPLPPIPTPTITDLAPYDTYQIQTTATTNTGKVQMPGTGVGKNGDVSAAVLTSGGAISLTTNWVAGRTGLPPEMPQFYTDDKNLIPLVATVVANQVLPSPDGANLVYLMAGFYIHGVLDPKKWQFTGPVPPFVAEATADGAKKAASSWVEFFGGGDKTDNNNANPLVPGGTKLDVPPVEPLGFGNLPVGTLPIGGFTDLGATAGLPADTVNPNPAGGGLDPFFGKQKNTP